MDQPIPPIKPKVSEREFIVLVATLMSIVALTIDALLPALGHIGRDLALENPNHAQYLIVAVFIGMAIGQMVAGPYSDATGRKPVLYVGIALFMAGSVAGFIAPTFEWLIAARILQGFGVAGPYVSAVSIVRDRFSGREMARLMSFVMMIFIAVPAVAPSLGQGILFIASWREIFLLYLGYALALGCWLVFRLEETLPPENRIPMSRAGILHGFREVTRNRATMIYTLCMGLCFGSFMGYLNCSQQIFQNQFGVGELFALYFGILALLLGIASLANARFVRRFGMQRICFRSFICIVIASALFLALHAATEVRLWMFVVYAGVLFFAFGLVFGNLNALAMEPMGHVAGIASAIIGASSSVISMALGTIIGQLYQNSLVPIVSGFLVLGTVVLGLLFIAAQGSEKELRQPLSEARVRGFLSEE